MPERPLTRGSSVARPVQNFAIWLVSLLFLCGAVSSASAATIQVQVLLDTDSSAGTGCTISTTLGNFQGAEKVLTTTVDTTSNTVTAVSLQTCTGGVLGAPVAITSPHAPPWPIGPGAGVNGSTLIETYMPLSALGGGSSVRVGVVTTDPLSQQDAILGGISFIPTAPNSAPIPTLSEWGLILFAVFLSAGALLIIRRTGGGVFVLLLVIFLTAGVALATMITLTGNPADWTGVPPLASKAPTSATLAQIEAFYAVAPGDGNLYFRVDVKICTQITVAPNALPAGSINVAYPTTTFTATGGVGAVTWSATGALPSGMTFSAGGVLSGTPTQTGSFPITFVATDANGCAGSQAITLVVNACPALTVAPSTLPSATGGTAYAPVTFTATGGTGTIAWTETGALPTGMTFTAAGVLSGTPTQTGTFPITFTATDANNCTGSQPINLVVTCPGLAVNPASLPGGTANAAYSQTLTGSGGTGPYTFAITAGALPAGLTLNAASGILSGSPTATGTFNFTVTATDSVSCTATRAYTIAIACPTITVSPASLPGGTANTAYSQAITATGGVGASTFSVTAGALPAGLTLSAAGLLAGTPTVTGTFNFTVTATDANACTGSTAYSLTIVCPTVTVSPLTLPAGTTGTAYSQTVSASGGQTPYTFTVTGTLPTGVTLNSASGLLSGTPTAAGPFNFTITATDANGCFGAQAYSVTITCPGVTVLPATLPGGTISVAYSQTVSGSGGTAPYTFALAGGTLPAGLTLDPTTGVLSGTPTAAATFNFQIRATDANGCVGLQAYSVTIVCPVIGVSPATLPDGLVGTGYSQTVSGVGGTAPYTFAVTAGALPDGLTLDPSTGAITGIPTTDGPNNFTITATDAHACVGSRAYAVKICPVISVNPGTLPDATINVPYLQTVSGSGGVDPYTFTVSAGALPPGLLLNANTGDISGTSNAFGSATFTIRATQADGCFGERAYTVHTCVAQNLVPAPGALASATVNNPYTSGVVASGGAGPYTYAVTAGSLPHNLSLNANSGAITGTPDIIGGSSFTITATDTATGCRIAGTYSIAVCAPITVTPPTLPPGTVGSNYGQTVGATGGSAPYTFAVTSGTLPDGLSLDSATGLVFGTPGTAGLFGFTVTATDAAGCTGSLAYSLRICPILTLAPLPSVCASVGGAFSQTIVASGGTGPYTYAVTAGALPGGLSLSAGGAITGTPLSAGSFGFTVTATDTATGCTGSQSYTIPVLGLAPAGPALPDATFGSAYNQTFTASGTAGPFSYAVTAGSVPQGLSISGAALLGTPTGTGTGTFNFTVTATDASNGCTVARSYTLISRPVAVLDAYNNGVGNTEYYGGGFAPTPTTPFVASATNILTNDLGPGLTATVVAQPANGVVTLNPDGSFRYTPTAGAQGSAAFTYNVTSNGVTSAAPATVTITLISRVWYVNSSGANGIGTSNSPFNNMNNADTSSVANDAVFVHTGAATTPGTIALAAGQVLWGQGAAFSIAGSGLSIAAGGKPTLTGTVSLGGAGIIVSSLNISSAATTGLSGTGALGTATIQNSVAITTTSGTGVSLSNVTGILNADSTTSVSAGSGTAFSADQGSATVNWGGPVASATGRTISITNRTGGTATFSGAVSGNGTGILLNSNTGSANAFTGGVSLSTGSSAAFTATGGGTVTVTGAGNTVTTTSGTAINVQNTSIGGAGLTFLSVSANGAVNGINLNTTSGSGGLTVLGSGSASSGGTIQNTTGAGISLTSTTSPSFNNMNIQNTALSGIAGTQVTNFTFTNGTINNSGTIAAPVDNRSNIGFGFQSALTENNVSGVVTITGNTLTNAYEHGIDIQNFAGTITNATISNNVLTSSTSSANTHGSAIRLLGFGSAGGVSNIVKATISTNTITNFPGGAGITSQYGNVAGGPSGTWGTPNSPTDIILIQGNFVNGQSAANPVGANAILATLTGAGQANWKIDGNGSVANPISNIAGTEIGVTVRGVNPVATCDITNNRILGIVSVNAQAIVFAADFLTATTDAPQLSGTISGNTVSGQDGEGITALATPGSSAHVSVSILNNNIGAPNCGGCNRYGITAQVGTSSGTITGNPSMCLKMTGNTSAGSGVNTGIGIRKKTAAYVFQVDGFVGGGDPTAYITGNNPAGGGVTMINQTTGFGNCVAP